MWWPCLWPAGTLHWQMGTAGMGSTGLSARSLSALQASGQWLLSVAHPQELRVTCQLPETPPHYRSLSLSKTSTDPLCVWHLISFWGL